MRMMVRLVSVVTILVLLPAAAYAQASIAGVVKDASGAVLPGVTVEAASPVLIEKTRSVVTDGTGQYKVIDLRPGSYTVTFTLPGFNTFRRDGIELTGSFTATVNADLKVGAVEESITVTGETPIVDLQSTVKERVLSHEVIEALPTGRLLANLGVLVPGVIPTSPGGQITGSFQDVGGSGGDQMTNLVAHGSRADNAQITTNGLNNNAISGFMGGRSPNPGATQEVAIDTGGVSAEAAEGGPRINMIPRDGGNTFKGAIFASFTNHALEGNNNTQDLINRGLPVPNSVYKIWDVNPGFGGPIKKDTLWFYTSVRHFGTYQYVGAGVFENRNANNPNAWLYDPDPSRPGISPGVWKDAQARLTWQATPKNKLAFSMDVQDRFSMRWIGGDISSPEAQSYSRFPQQRAFSAQWTVPVTNRLLLDVGAFEAVEGFHSDIHPDATNATQMINVVEQSTGRSYRSPATYSQPFNEVLYPRVSLSYVTGAHAFKIGYNDEIGYAKSYTYQVQPPVSYRFNIGVPNQLTQYATPYSSASNIPHDVGLFAQDKWTINRMTLNLGVRYDWVVTYFPTTHLGSGPLVPTRDITFPETPFQNYKDVTPRMGVVYDLFGTGQTAVRVSLNKYLKGGLGSTGGNPAGSIVTSTTRTWTDSNGNFIPDCDLTNTAKNGECDKMANPNFGKPVPGITYDPIVNTGWGHRNYNWEFSTGVQQQILPRVAMDVAYFRRWFGNFPVTDNLTVAASDYNSFSITAPVNPLLPGGGGYTVSGLLDLDPAKFGLPANNYQTLDSTYGNQIEHYNGVDFSLNARLSGGTLLQGGFSTGKRVMDNCEIVSKVPEMLFNMGTLTYVTIANSWLPAQYCHQETGLETQVKLLGVYMVPKVDVQVSATFQSVPGPLLYANYNAPNAVVLPSLGRSLSGGAPNLTVDLVPPGSAYGDRLNQLDLRFGKILKFGRTRTAVNVDLYNALNRNPVLLESQAYATYRQPQQIMLARFAKIGVNFDF